MIFIRQIAHALDEHELPRCKNATKTPNEIEPGFVPEFNI
jgi:hypothetical protein